MRREFCRSQIFSLTDYHRTNINKYFCVTFAVQKPRRNYKQHGTILQQDPIESPIPYPHSKILALPVNLSKFYLHVKNILGSHIPLDKVFLGEG